MHQLQLQIPLLQDPALHAGLLHPSQSFGLVTIGFKEPDGWVQKLVAPSELPYVVRQLVGHPDTYLSQARFRGSRAIARLAQIGVLWADLDYYRQPEWWDAAPGQVLEEACRLLDLAEQPRPTMAISSGRGLYVCWRHSPVPRAALPRWQACQKALQATLKPLGADPLAQDGARVLRLVGTRHRASQALVEFLEPPDPGWDFDRLADAVLPWTRAELQELRKERARERGESRVPSATRGIRTWWEVVLTDLQRLLEVRWAGSLPAGQRDAWMFAASIASSWITPPQVLAREVAHLGAECAYWGEGETRSRMNAVLSRAWRAARGETVEWRGQERDPRYWLRRQTLVDWLKIEDDEMRRAGMRALVTQEIRREQKTELERARSHAAGEVQITRKQYEDRAQDRSEKARRLRGEGLSIRAIAAELGVSKSQTHRYLSS